MKKRSDATTEETQRKPRKSTRSRELKAATKTPLVVVLRKPGMSIDIRIDRPRSLSKAFMPFLPQMAHLIQSSPVIETSHRRRGGLAGASLVDFVIEDIGKLAPSNEDLARLRKAIEDELTRRHEAS